MHFRTKAVILSVMLLLSARSGFTAPQNFVGPPHIVPVTRVKSILFKTEKGDVTFNHDQHVKDMKSEACIPCHKTNKPTKSDSFSRFDARTAHYFCKGCHREKGLGPTECHECHKLKKP